MIINDDDECTGVRHNAETKLDKDKSSSFIPDPSPNPNSSLIFLAFLICVVSALCRAVECTNFLILLSSRSSCLFYEFFG